MSNSPQQASCITGDSLGLIAGIVGPGVRLHMEKALECLTDEFNAGRAGPSGLRAQAIAHVHYALIGLGTLEDR